ncbi:HEAT repeat domain-containing protein [Alkalinema pantanalense CENA528]|uniref:HEAT repeat domain-containing protein n=1 Tax=Alkalinema pantanalense TaxID=1620705 RepID=UPI003D6FBB68
MQADDSRSLVSFSSLGQCHQWDGLLQEIQALLQESLSTASSRRKPSVKLPTDVADRVLVGLLDVLVGGDFQTKWEAAKLLPLLEDRAIEPLLALLEDEDLEPEVHWFVVRLLGNSPTPKTLQALLTCIQTHPQEEVRAMATQVLGGQGPPVLALVENLLQSPLTRLQGVNILAQIRSPQSISQLLMLVNDANAQVRVTAIEALTLFQTPEIVPRLLQALEDPVARVRRAALAGLTFGNLSEHPTLVPLIQARLWDVDIQVCCQAAVCLRRIGSPEAVTILRSALQSSVLPDPLAIELIRSLIWIATEQSLDGVLQALDQGNLSAAVAQETLTLLGRIESPDLKPRVASWLILRLGQGANPAIERPQLGSLDCQVMISALGQLQEPIAINGLIQLLAQADTMLRLHIVAALRQFEGVYAQLETLANQPSSASNLKQGLAIALKEW